MKLVSSLALVLMLGAAACGAKKDQGADPGSAAPAGSAMAATGSAGSAAPAGSAMAATGSGSAAPAAGSAAGSGSAVAAAGSDAAGSAAAGSASGSGAGSGSAVAMAGSDDDPTNYPHHDGDTFDQMSREERGKFMKEHVTPDMKAAFQKFDAKKYANFGCKTCHGKDPKAVHFHMPSPELPKLDFEKLKAGKQEPKIAKFMGDVVEPQMAKLLGAQPFDMATQKGFGCLDCHMQKK